MSDKPDIDRCLELEAEIERLHAALDWAVSLVGVELEGVVMPPEHVAAIEASLKRIATKRGA
jgi:hypothetical protein